MSTAASRAPVAVITGGSSEIGRATAIQLAELGHDIVVHYGQSRAEADATIAELTKRGREAIAVAGDIADDAACRQIIDVATSAFGRIDVLVNNAGTTVFVPHVDLDALTTEAWDRVFAVNVRGAFQMARAAASTLRTSGRGVIVNVSSIAGETAVGSSIPYAASKAALDNLTVSLARVLAPAVRVVGVAPGYVETRRLQEGYGEKLDAMRKLMKQYTPLRGVGQPEHVARVVGALVSTMDWVTGQTITVDGGFSIRG